MIKKIKIIKLHKSKGFVYGVSSLVEGKYHYLKPIKELMFMKFKGDYYLKAFEKGNSYRARLDKGSDGKYRLVFVFPNTEEFIYNSDIFNTEVNKMALKNLTADRQEMIVKQSCLTRAIEILSYNKADPMTSQMVKDMANDLKEWVMKK